MMHSMAPSEAMHHPFTVLLGGGNNQMKEPLHHLLIKITVRQKLGSFENKYLG
jgi:hypothetical protein